MKDRLKSFFIKQKPFIALFMGFVLLAASVAIGLRADATPMPTQTLSGTITSSQTLSPSYVYIVSPDVAIASGATLTIPAGTIVKFQSGPITVRQGGSLRVTGTAASPVHFTSIKDDTVGGDTNGDGNATAPAMDDYQRAVATEDGDVNIVFAKFNYFARAVEGSRTTGSIVVTDSTFNNGHVAIAVGGPTVKLYRNTFGNLEPYSLDGAVQVSSIQDLTKVSLSGIDQNVFTGTAKFSRIIRITQAVLPAGKTWSPASSSGAQLRFYDRNYIYGAATIGQDIPVVLSGNGALYAMNSGAVITIQAGVQIKYENDSSRIMVGSDAKLYVTGTSTKTVHFTSIKDDTVGGDTNGDGSATIPSADDLQYAVYGQNGDLNIVFAEFNYTRQAVEAVRSVGSIVVTDSTFDNGRNAIRVEAATVKLYRNTFKNLIPDSISGPVRVEGVRDLSKISLSGTDQNKFTGTAKFARNITVSKGYLPAGKTWSPASTSGAVLFISNYVEIDGAATIGSELTVVFLGQFIIKGSLNIHSGASLKFDSFITAYPGGTVNVSGDTNAKVVFTSMKDDSVAGDTNGDDNDSSPSQNDLMAYVRSNQDSTVTVKHAIFKEFSNDSIGAGGYSNSYCSAGAITVEDTVFNTPLVLTNCGSTQSLILKKNTFAVTNREPLSIGNVDMSGVSLSGPDKNIFVGTGKSRVLKVSSTTRIDPGKNVEIEKTTGAIILLSSQLHVEGSLTVQSGNIFRINGGYISSSGGAIQVNGSQGDEVIFTSDKDDSIGGDVTGDGDTSPSIPAYFSAIQAGLNSTASIHNAIFKYGENSITGYAGSSVCAEGGTVEVSDSLLYAPVSFASCGVSGNLTLKRNTFNTLTTAVSIRSMDATNIILSGADKNIFYGQPEARRVSISQANIPSGKTWKLDGSSNATLTSDGSGLYVYGSLELSPGAKLKGYAPILQAGGQIKASGNQSGDIIMTSWRDDTVGGDTNGDGAASVPEPGDYLGFVVPTDASLNMSGIDIRYTSTAVQVEGGNVDIRNSRISFVSNGIINTSGKTVFRGEMKDVSEKAAVACNWGRQNCLIDAAFTDWGITSGPHAKICGQVIASPWKYGTQVSEGNFFVQNCGGYPTPSEDLNNSATAFQQGVAMKNIDCANGFQDACEAAHNAFVCLSGGVNVISSTSPVPLPEIEPDGDIQSYNDVIENSAQDFIRDKVVEQVSPLNNELDGRILNIYDLYQSLKQAYNNCAP